MTCPLVAIGATPFEVPISSHARTKSHDRIKQLRDEAGTVFLVAHNLGEIEQSCTRVLWMEAGQILRDSDDVPGVIDEYLAATGGEPRDRERARL